MDTNLANGDAGDVARLLLVSSLANVPGATRGLAIPEVVGNLCAPNRDVSKLKNEVISRFMTTAWYLHTTGDGKLFFKNVRNLVARLKTTADAYLRDQSIKELKTRLEEMLRPDDGWCYQKLDSSFSTMSKTSRPPSRGTRFSPDDGLVLPCWRAGDEMRNSQRMRCAHRTALACKPERALQVKERSQRS